MLRSSLSASASGTRAKLRPPGSRSTSPLPRVPIHKPSVRRFGQGRDALVRQAADGRAVAMLEEALATGAALGQAVPEGADDQVAGARHQQGAHGSAGNAVDAAVAEAFDLTGRRVEAVQSAVAAADPQAAVAVAGEADQVVAGQPVPGVAAIGVALQHAAFGVDSHQPGGFAEGDPQAAVRCRFDGDHGVGRQGTAVAVLMAQGADHRGAGVVRGQAADPGAEPDHARRGPGPAW
jgi:hypothetical protein